MRKIRERSVVSSGSGWQMEATLSKTPTRERGVQQALQNGAPPALSKQLPGGLRRSLCSSSWV